jgi:predicted nuclease of predicted toxin-antitoxin system
MQFLIDADLPRATQHLLEEHGYPSLDVRDIGLGQAPDSQIADYARLKNFCLVTADWGFSDIRSFPPEQYGGIVVLGLPDHANGKEILEVFRLLLQRPDLVAELPGRLAVVERGRIRLRPPI